MTEGFEIGGQGAWPDAEMPPYEPSDTCFPGVLTPERHQNLRTITEALCPPNPNVFESAARTGRSFFTLKV